MSEQQETDREILMRLRLAADIYQASVRPVLRVDSPEARRVFERDKALQEDLLDAIGAAAKVLGR